MSAEKELLFLAFFGSIISRVFPANPWCEPEFIDLSRNITVTKGEDAALPCGIDFLGKRSVAWLEVKTKTLLTLNEKTITKNPLIHVTHSSNSKYWTLHIHKVTERNQGYYMCQINTIPMKSQLTYLNVLVSPSFVLEELVTKLTVFEGEPAILTCKAKGNPPPMIFWKRQDDKDIEVRGKRVNVFEGEVLFIEKANRLHMGIYICTAVNVVPPEVNHWFYLTVEFSPTIKRPNVHLWKNLGAEVTLKCDTEAYPKSHNYWKKDNKHIITVGDNFVADIFSELYSVRMKLKIYSLEPEDFGTYQCIAENKHGIANGTTWLFQIPPSYPLILDTTERPSINKITETYQQEPLTLEEEGKVRFSEDLKKATDTDFIDSSQIRIADMQLQFSMETDQKAKPTSEPFNQDTFNKITDFGIIAAGNVHLVIPSAIVCLWMNILCFIL